MDKITRCRVYAAPVEGTWMEPIVPNGSINLFQAGIDGSHRGKIVCVGRFSDNTAKESRAVGVIAINNMEDTWRNLSLRLDFLSAAAQPIMLNDAYYRIISEWITVLDEASNELILTEAFQSPPQVEGPTFDEWLSMPKASVVSVAASHPVPPEVFAKYSDLVF